MNKIIEAKNGILIFVLFSLFVLITPTVLGMANPASVYCNALNYTYDIQTSTCILPDNQAVPGWQFLIGKVGTEYSYCSLKGYKIETINDENTCISLGVDTCAVCVLPNGTKVEVTQLMNLSFSSSYCGDNMCNLGEDYKTCPQDCPSGSFDGYCDMVNDGICDPDCTPDADPDCTNITNNETQNETQNKNRTQNKNKTIAPVGKCGDGICESFESYKNCPRDCPSGGEDGYCDKVKDLICDPDCKQGEDPDCKKQVERPGIIPKGENNNKVLLFSSLLILVVVLILLILIHVIRRKPGQIIEERAKQVNNGEYNNYNNPGYNRVNNTQPDRQVNNLFEHYSKSYGERAKREKR